MGLHLLYLAETRVTSGGWLRFFFLAIVIRVIIYRLLRLIAIFFIDAFLMPVHELDGPRNFGDLIDATCGEVYSGNRNLFFRRAFLSFLLKGGRWAFYQDWCLFGLSRLLMKLEWRLTGSPHTINLESFAHLFLLI